MQVKYVTMKGHRGKWKAVSSSQTWRTPGTSGWSPGICMSNQFPGGADAADLGDTPYNHWVKKRSLLI